MMEKNKNMNNQSITIVTLSILITVIIFLQFPIIQEAEAENSVNVTLYANNYGYNTTKGGPEIKAILGDKIIIHLTCTFHTRPHLKQIGTLIIEGMVILQKS